MSEPNNILPRNPGYENLQFLYFITLPFMAMGRLSVFMFNHVAESLKLKNLIYGFYNALLLVSSASMIFLGHLFFYRIWVMAIGWMGWIILFLFIWHRFMLKLRPSYELRAFKMAKISFIWLTIAALSSTVLYVVHQYNTSLYISGSAVIISDIFGLLTILAILIFFSSLLFVQSFRKYHAAFKFFHFLRQLIIRLPRLISGSIFYLSGVLIVSVLPVIFVIGLNSTIKYTSDRNLMEWQKEIRLIPGYLHRIENEKNASISNQEKLTWLEKQKDALDLRHPEKYDQTSLQKYLSDYEINTEFFIHQINRTELNIQLQQEKIIERILAFAGMWIIFSILFSGIFSFTLAYFHDLYDFPLISKHSLSNEK